MPADHTNSSSDTPDTAALRALVSELDLLVIATALAMASITPGPAGEAGAIAAIAFDMKHKRWYGIVLSATSMVPILGYIPAIFKVGLLLFLLNRQLNLLEAMLSEAREPSNASILVGSALERYYHKIPDIWLTRRILKRLGRIMDLGRQEQQVAPSSSCGLQENNSNSNEIPE